MNPDQMPASHLPALLSSPAALLHRTQAALGLLQEVVQESSAEYWYAKGLSLSTRIEAGSYSSQDKLLVPLSLNAFKRCYEIDSMHWRSAVRLSLALCVEGMFSDAADILLEAYKKTDSHEFKFHSELCFSERYPPDEEGITWFNDCNEWKTIECGFIKQIKRNKAGFNECLSLALIQNLNKDWKQARESLQLTNIIYPNESDKSSIYFENLGSVLTNDWLLAKEKGWNNVLNLALANYDRSIELDPTRANPYLLRSTVKLRLRDFTGSLIDANRAVELYPSAASYESRSFCNEELGNSTEAKSDNAMCLTLFCCSEHATKLYNEQNYNEALIAFGQAIKLEPWEVKSYEYRADIKRLLKDDTGAELDLIIANLITKAVGRGVIKSS